MGRAKGGVYLLSDKLSSLLAYQIVSLGERTYVSQEAHDDLIAAVHSGKVPILHYNESGNEITLAMSSGILGGQEVISCFLSHTGAVVNVLAYPSSHDSITVHGLKIT